MRYAERVLADTEELARWVEGRRTGRAGPLRVGLIDVAAVDHFSEPLRAFRRERPEVELHLTVAPSGEVLDLLTRGALDLAVCVAPDPDPPWWCGRCGTSRWRSTPRKAPGSARPRAGARGSRSPPAPGPGPSWPTPCGSGARPFEVVAESHQPEVLAEMVRLGVGWTVLPVIQAERGPDPLRRAVKAVLTTRTLAAVQRADRAPTPAADALVALLSASGCLILRPSPGPARRPHELVTRVRPLRRGGVEAPATAVVASEGSEQVGRHAGRAAQPGGHVGGLVAGAAFGPGAPGGGVASSA